FCHVRFRAFHGQLHRGIDGLPMMPEDPYAYVEAALQAPPSPDFVPGPKDPEQAPPLPDYVPGPEYPGYLAPADDEIVVEDQPYAEDALPTTDSPGYIANPDPEEDLEEEDDKDPTKGPTDYPSDKDDDEEEEESSGDNADEEEEDEDEDKEEEEEEEHLAPTESVLPPQTGTRGARMTVRPQPPMTASIEALIDVVAARLPLPSPPPSPLTSYSSPLPQIPSPPLPTSPPLPISPSPLPASPTHSLSYRAAMIRLRAESPSTSHPLPLPPLIILLCTKASMAMMRAAAPSTYCLAPLSGTPPLLPIPLPTSSPHLLLPSTDYRAKVPIEECSSALTARPTRGFRADYGFVGTLDAEIRRDPDREIGYGITDIWEDPDEIAKEILATDVAELGQRMTNFVTTVRQDTDEIYGRSHARIARLMKGKARASREAWVQSMDASDMACFEVSALWTTVLAQQTEIRDLRAADHK
ncbi:hypothetical protein Tco_1453941, partial [Tanacetum coccineum]